MTLEDIFAELRAVKRRLDSEVDAWAVQQQRVVKAMAEARRRGLAQRFRFIAKRIREEQLPLVLAKRRYFRSTNRLTAFLKGNSK